MASNLFQLNADWSEMTADILLSGKLGSGANLAKLGAVLQRGVIPALAACGALEYATTTALKALPVASINATLALEGVETLRASVLDRGDGTPGLVEWVPSSSSTASSFVLAPDDIGSDNGRWHVLAGFGRLSTPTGYGTSSVNPTVTDDAAHGQGLGFLWRNTATGEVFVCTDTTADAAVWKTVRPARVAYAPAAAAKRVTATSTKTLPSGLALTLPANFPVGARLDFKAICLVVGSNGTDTLTFAVETSDGVALASVSAFDMTDGDTVIIEGSLVVTATGASAALLGTVKSARTGQTATLAPSSVSPNLSAARTVGPYITLSSNNAGNIVDVRMWQCEAWSMP